MSDYIVVDDRSSALEWSGALGHWGGLEDPQEYNHTSTILLDRDSSMIFTFRGTYSRGLGVSMFNFHLLLPGSYIAVYGTVPADVGTAATQAQSSYVLDGGDPVTWLCPQINVTMYNVNFFQTTLSGSEQHTLVVTNTGLYAGTRIDYLTYK